jgi:hypothetical protein
MKRRWKTEELIEHFTLLPDELTLLANKTGATRLGFAVLLKYFQWNARFPSNHQDVPNEIVAYIAKQVGVPPQQYFEYDWNGRTINHHHIQIRTFFGFRKATLQDVQDMADWLCQHILAYDHQIDHLHAVVYQQFRQLHIEPPTPTQIDRLIRSSIHTYEARFFSNILTKLKNENRSQMDMLLTDEDSTDLAASSDKDTSKPKQPNFQELKTDPGGNGLSSAFAEIAKLQCIRQVGLPADLFQDISPKVLYTYRQRAATEPTCELKRHPDPIRYSLMAAFCWLRSQEVTDNLVELLIHLVHRISSRANRKVTKELLNDLRKVSGKNGLLFHLAEAAVSYPDGIVKEVLYPVVNEQTLTDIVKEFKSTGIAYRQQVYTVIRASYRSHYRRLMPDLLKVLEFRSNNEVHRPIISALELLKKYAGSKQRYYTDGEKVPLDGVVRNSWREIVEEQDKDGQKRVNRINYEICVLQTLREKLRCKEIWVVGANRYRNPDEDLPTDFDKQREAYYGALHQPLDSDAFTAALKKAMATALETLDSNLPKNPSVKILNKAKGWISLSPLDAQPEPANLTHLKAEIARRWPMTSLLDILKETDLRVEFTKQFKSVASRENLDQATLQKRLLLCLYGLGTNTGLKRVSTGEHGENYHDLRYIRRRFIHKEQLRCAIIEVVNAIFRIRRPDIWGEGTTACASDSKKFGVWDQNLMTEWHIRYEGKGVMIYWHVERKSACIYSQLKTCSSSEVAAMIEGVLRHCTEMAVKKNYVDSHGQSEVAFAFCYLQKCCRMPRPLVGDECNEYNIRAKPFTRQVMS